MPYQISARIQSGSLCVSRYCFSIGDESDKHYRMCKKFDDPFEPCRVTANLWLAYTYAGEILGSEYDPSMISKGLFRGFLIEHICMYMAFITTFQACFEKFM